MQMTGQTQTNIRTRQFTDEQMKRYFAKIPIWAIVAVAFGGLLMLCGFSPNLSSLIAIGIITILAGIAVIAVMTGGTKPTDEEYDKWLEDQVQAILSSAPTRLGLDPSQITSEPFHVHGFVLPGMRSASKYRVDELKWKIGKDGKPRFSVNIYTYFYPADHHLAVFARDINALNQSAHNEKAEEYFYQDIVGAKVNDEQDYITIKKKQYQYRVQEFALRINNGDSIGASVNATPLDNKQNIPSFHIPNSGIETTIAQLRMLLRDKKQHP